MVRVVGISMAYTRTFENVQPFFGSPYSKQSVSHIESKGKAGDDHCSR